MNEEPKQHRSSQSQGPIAQGANDDSASPRSSRRSPRWRSVRRGVAIIEFAIAIPLFLILLATVYEGGNFFYTYFRLSGAAFQGSRFCSSLMSPVPNCFDTRGGVAPLTTNLALWSAPVPTDPQQKAVFEFHKWIHDRVATIFYINPAGWQIKSDELVPDGSGKKVSQIRSNFPTIKTQYIGRYDEATTQARCNPDPTIEEENSCTVCIFAEYTGWFFDIPIKSCSTAFVLVNNEGLSLPFNTPASGNNTSYPNYNYNYNYYYNYNYNSNYNYNYNSNYNYNGNS